MKFYTHVVYRYMCTLASGQWSYQHLYLLIGKIWNSVSRTVAFNLSFFHPELLADLQGRADTHLFSSRMGRCSAFLGLIALFPSFVPTILMKMLVYEKQQNICKWTLILLSASGDYEFISHTAISWGWPLVGGVLFFNHCSCGIRIWLIGLKSKSLVTC